MNIAIANRYRPSQISGEEEYPLAAAFKELGHQIALCDLSDLAISSQGEPLIDGQLLKADLLLWRASETLWDSAVPFLAACEAQGISTINSSQAVALSANKWLTHQALLANGLPSVPSALLVSGANLAASGQRQVIKPIYGAGGIGVRLVEPGEEIRAFETSLIQPWAGDAGSIGRVLVGAGEVIGAMRRQAEVGQFINNYERGGEPERWSAPSEALDLACLASEVLGVSLAGVDLVYFDQRWHCLEVNSSPGYRGFIELAGSQFHDLVAQACLAEQS